MGWDSELESTTHTYDGWLTYLLSGEINLLKDPVCAFLTNEAYVYDSTHKSASRIPHYIDSVQELTNKSVVDGKFMADNLTWRGTASNLGRTIRHAIIYAKDRPIICVSFAGPIIMSGGDISVKWNDREVLSLERLEKQRVGFWQWLFGGKNEN